MPDLDPQVILVFLMVVVAGVKALIERFQAKQADQNYDPLEELQPYEPEPEEREIIYRRQTETPQPQVELPPLPSFTPPPLEVVPTQVTQSEPPRVPAPIKHKTPVVTRSTEQPTTKSRLKDHLSSPTAAREALLLSEILGPPKSLR